jgi:hypothetical protein
MEPNELEMLRARERIQRSRIEYFEAVASHHLRVAQSALTMRHIIDARRHAATKQTDEALECLVKQIEKSFSEAFGAKMIEDEPVVVFTPVPNHRAFAQSLALDEKYKCTGSNATGQTYELEASDEATETREETE